MSSRSRPWKLAQGELRALTVTYQSLDNEVAVKEGVGTSTGDCLAHADGQLSVGTWTRLTVSSPNSIYDDLKNDGKRPHPSHARRYKGEGAIVQVVAETRLVRIKDAA